MRLNDIKNNVDKINGTTDEYLKYVDDYGEIEDIGIVFYDNPLKKDVNFAKDFPEYTTNTYGDYTLFNTGLWNIQKDNREHLKLSYNIIFNAENNIILGPAFSSILNDNTVYVYGTEETVDENYNTANLPKTYTHILDGKTRFDFQYNTNYVLFNEHGLVMAINNLDSNLKYIVFNFKSKCYVKCTNCSFVLPENSGSNKITNFTSNVEYDTRKYPVLKEILRFTNCDAINIKAERDLFNEITVNKDFDNSYNLNNNPWSASMNQNSWYKVLLLSEGFHKFIVQIANDQISEVEIFVDRSNSRITVKDLYHSNFHNKSFNVALANGFIDDTDIYFAYLVFQSIDNDSQLNITIENIKNTWATQKYAVGSMIPLDNPTIVTQSNLLPN